MNRKESGLTLIELMIVVLIIAIIAGIAMVSYQSYQRRTMLAVTTQHLLEVQGDIEMHRLKKGGNYANYTLADKDKSIYHGDNKIYTVAVDTTARTYSVTATVTDGVSKKLLAGCKQLSINHIGEKSPKDGKCW